ncbi:hypothetical protein GH714_043634 [Hevea brasiliensis]|uniref:Glucose-methanol-choline oxidoreductase N-terminal domain-containing protein n=1 Tax=Hevea brasiliensis TaxID=3981 RepID=A0A6A6K3I7_HEVBR|nr:hypothetical protein GH714_043634 [Hevea brasiliensis]
MGHRGRVLGGSSAINGGFYSRASDEFVEKVGWDRELVKECYEWVESKIFSKPELAIWQSVVEFGLLEAGFLPYNGLSWEHVEGTKIGGTMFDEFGIRHTSADLLGVGNPENITILLTATVQNIIFHSNGKGNEKIARGIRSIRQSPNPNVSGIGPEKHLKNFNIPLVLDLKGVGQEMKDNPAIALLADTKAEYRLPDTPQVAGIAKDFKFIVQGGILPISFNATRMPMAIKLAFPESKGKLKLNSKDPRQNPSVQFNYLSKEDTDG